MKSRALITMIMSLLVAKSNLAGASTNIALRKTKPSLAHENSIVLTYQGKKTYLMIMGLAPLSNQKKLRSDLEDMLVSGTIGQMLGEQPQFAPVTQQDTMSLKQVVAYRKSIMDSFFAYHDDLYDYRSHIDESLEVLESKYHLQSNAVQNMQKLNEIFAASSTETSTLPAIKRPRSSTAVPIVPLLSLETHATICLNERIVMLTRNVENAIKKRDHEAYGKNFLSLADLIYRVEDPSHITKVLARSHNQRLLLNSLVSPTVNSLLKGRSENLDLEGKALVNQLAILSQRPNHDLSLIIAGIVTSVGSELGSSERDDLLKLVQASDRDALMARVGTVTGLNLADSESLIARLVKNIRV